MKPKKSKRQPLQFTVEELDRMIAKAMDNIRRKFGISNDKKMQP